MTASASIGRFVLGRRLGAGGFATVWLAHDYFGEEGQRPKAAPRRSAGNAWSR